MKQTITTHQSNLKDIVVLLKVIKNKVQTLSFRIIHLLKHWTLIQKKVINNLLMIKMKFRR